MTMPALSGSRTISTLVGNTSRGAGGSPCGAGVASVAAAGGNAGGTISVAGGMVIGRFCAWLQIGRANATAAQMNHTAARIAEGAVIFAPMVLAAAENASNVKPRATGVQGAVLSP